MSNEVKISKDVSELNVIDKTPALVVDGNSLNINENGICELLFFQFEKIEGKVTTVRGVGTYRMNLEQLEVLQRVIEETIKEHNAKKNITS